MDELRAGAQPLPVNLGRRSKLHGPKEAEIGIVLPKIGIDRQLKDSTWKKIVVGART